jgi:hypothetical protein
MHGCKWGLLKVTKGNTEGAWWSAGGVFWQIDSMLFFFRHFKTYTNQQVGQIQEIPTQQRRKSGGAWVVPSQVRVG